MLKPFGAGVHRCPDDLEARRCRIAAAGDFEACRQIIFAALFGYVDLLFAARDLKTVEEVTVERTLCGDVAAYRLKYLLRRVLAFGKKRPDLLESRGDLAEFTVVELAQPCPGNDLQVGPDRRLRLAEILAELA